MTYDLTIPVANQQPHLDIENDIQKLQNGLFTCTLSINNGTIVDYTLTEYADANTYLRLESIIIEQLTIAFNTPTRDQTNALRQDGSKR